MIRRLLIMCFTAVLLCLPAAAVAQQADPGVIIHVVQRGETLFRIALNYGVTVQELASLNTILDPGNIQVGQRLLVPNTAISLLESPQTHVVQPGETLRSIAQLYNLSMDDLVVLNNVANPDSIYVGQVLNLSVVAETPTIPTPTVSVVEEVVQTVASAFIHTVQPGETIFRIATSYGLTVNDLASANSISDPTLIYTGQQLIIPGIEMPQLALDLPSTVTSLDINPLIFVEGQTGRIRLTTSIPMAMSGLFLDRGIADAAEQGNTVHTILVGVPIFTVAGIYPLSLMMTNESGQPTSISLNIQIVDGNYGSEYINLLADRANLLDPNVESAELNFVQSVMSNFTPTHLPAFPYDD